MIGCYFNLHAIGAMSIKVTFPVEISYHWERRKMALELMEYKLRFIDVPHVRFEIIRMYLYFIDVQGVLYKLDLAPIDLL
jgi:hypothetical protein